MATCTHNFRSKRTYPQRICKNANCTHGKYYTPHDARQVWCCPPCGVEAYNDGRSKLNNSKFLPEKQLRIYDKLLGKLYAQYEKNNHCLVHKLILQHEQLDPSLNVEQQTNTQTGQQVKWYYEFGIEIHPTSKEHFIIHKKEIQ